MASMEVTLHHVETTELIVFAGVLRAGRCLGHRPGAHLASPAAPGGRNGLPGDRASAGGWAGDAVRTGARYEDPRTEVGQVSSAFNRMLGHVESALARRAASETRLRRFAADASHELRTPLAAIRGYAELARRHPGPVPEEVSDALARVEAESARMSVLVDELLLLARLDAGLLLARSSRSISPA